MEILKKIVSLWRPALAVLLALGLGWILGRCGQDDLASKETAKTSVETKADTKKAAESDKKADVAIVADNTTKGNSTYRRREEYNCPDGKLSSVTEEGTKSESSASTVTTKATTTEKTKTSEATKTSTVATTERVKLVYNPGPKWILTLGAGVSVPALLNSNPAPQYIPGVPKQLILTASVNRKLVGPVYGGVWGASTGAVGLGVTVGF